MSKGGKGVDIRAFFAKPSAKKGSADSKEKPKEKEKEKPKKKEETWFPASDEDDFQETQPKGKLKSSSEGKGKDDKKAKPAPKSKEPEKKAKVKEEDDEEEEVKSKTNGKSSQKKAKSPKEDEEDEIEEEEEVDTKQSKKAADKTPEGKGTKSPAGSGGKGPKRKRAISPPESDDDSEAFQKRTPPTKKNSKSPFTTPPATATNKTPPTKKTPTKEEEEEAEEVKPTLRKSPRTASDATKEAFKKVTKQPSFKKDPDATEEEETPITKKGKENKPETTNKKTPEKATDKKTPDKATDKKTTNKTPDKETTNDKKTPDKASDKKTPDKKTPENKNDKKTPETKVEKKTPEEKKKKTPEEKKKKNLSDDDEDMTEVDDDDSWMNPEKKAALKRKINESPQHSPAKKAKLDFVTPEPKAAKPKTASEEKAATKAKHVDTPRPKTEPPKAAVKAASQSQDDMKPPEEKSKPKAKWYGSYANRPPPPNRGLKTLPEGEPNCLGGKTFVITGVLDSLERDDAQDLIKSFGGHVAKSVTKATGYAVVGTEPGEKKMEVIQERGIKILSEEDLFEMIRTSKGVKQSPKKVKNVPVSPVKPKPSATLPTTTTTTPTTTSSSGASSANSANGAVETQMWVDKYKPKTTNELVGNPGKVKELVLWLQGWNATKLDPKSGERAALLSGPPGIGKTSSASIVARSCGYEPVEFNASDQRNKKSLEGFLDGVAGSKSIGGFFTAKKDEDENNNSKGKNAITTPPPAKKICLIMDEVDGMSGQQDRAGIGELIKVIQKSKVPIICICNDYYSPKIKSLVKYCKDIRFSRPMVSSAKPRLIAIARHIDDLAVEKVLESAHGDLRQALNILQMWSRSANRAQISHVDAKKRLELAEKDVEISPFSAIESLLTGRAMRNLGNRLDMYFVDYGIMSLFVQENYLNNRPIPHDDLRNVDALDAACKAAEFISDGDVVDRVVRSQMRWDLLNTHGVLSTVAPSYYVQGALTMRPMFPGWLGKNSTSNKRNRLLTEVQMHMRSVVSADKAQVMLDYLPALQQVLTRPLIERGQDAIDEVIDFMDEYCISRDDWDSVMELSPGASDEILKQIPTQVKSAFTRKYNAEAHLTKMGAVFSKMAPNRSMAYEYEEDEPAFIETDVNTAQEEEEGAEEDDVKADKMIKMPKAKAKSAAKGKKGKAKEGKAKEGDAGPAAKKAGKKAAPKKKN